LRAAEKSCGGTRWSVFSETAVVALHLLCCVEAVAAPTRPVAPRMTAFFPSQFGYVNRQNVLRTFATKTDQPPQNHRFEEMICAGNVHQTRPDDVIAPCLSSPRVPLCGAAALRHP
jgi:hypothetical protein